MSFITHRIKKILKSILPETIVAFIVHARGEKLKSLDLSVLSALKNATTENLSDYLFLETRLLPKLGFNNEKLDEFPEELHDYCGNGLLHWQYPNQFSQYLMLLSKLKPESYLEIGVRHGGTFLITVEYLKKFTVVKKAIAVDIAYPPSLAAYKKMNRVIWFYQLNSQTSSFNALLVKEKILIWFL